MKNKPQTRPQAKKENEHMQSVKTSRPCTIVVSIAQSCQKVRKMRDGKMLENPWINFLQLLNNGVFPLKLF